MEMSNKHNPCKYGDCFKDTSVQFWSTGGQQHQHLWQSWANYAQKAGHLPTQAQLVLRLAMGWMVRGLNPGGGEIFHTHPDRPWGPPSLLYTGYWVLPGGKVAGVWC
jgi:hypothetical protein